jgi:nucleotide-binding universal stress UspA family protein
MYKKILSPMDGLEFAECSLEHLRSIATGCNVPEIVLLTVIEPFPPTTGISDDWRNKLEKEAQAEAEDYLTKLVERLNLNKENVTIKTAIARGRPAGNILKYASEHNVDLIIMSTHGRSGVLRWVFGSVANKVLRHSPVPVLIASPIACRANQ